MKNFRNLKVWSQGIEIVTKTYELSQKLPSKEQYGLISQLTRASVSIPANVAEGSSRTSKKDFERFLQISIGSAFELETLLIVAEHLKMLVGRQLDDLKALVVEEQKMLNGLLKTSRNS